MQRLGTVRQWTAKHRGETIEVAKKGDKFYLNGEELQYGDLIAKLENMGVLAVAGVRKRADYKKLCVRCRLSYIVDVDRCICGNLLRTAVRSKVGREESLGISRIAVEPLEVLEE